MSQFAEDQKALADICREIVSLGDPPYQHDYVESALDDELKRCLESSLFGRTLFFNSLVRGEDDPISRYHKVWAWKALPLRGEADIERERRDTEFRQIIGAPEQPEWYWKTRLAHGLKQALGDQALAYDFVARFGPTSEYEQAQEKAAEKIKAAFGIQQNDNVSVLGAVRNVFDPQGKYGEFERNPERVVEIINSAFRTEGSDKASELAVVMKLASVFDPENKYQGDVDRTLRVHSFVGSLRKFQAHKHSNQILMGIDLEKFVSQIERAEAKYLSDAKHWVDRRLDLENRLFRCSPSLEIFRRNLIAELLPLESDSICASPPGFAFISGYWDHALRALARYFSSVESSHANVLTGSRHGDNLRLAERLKNRLDGTLLDLPDGFEPAYEVLSEKLAEFLSEPASKLTPKKAHGKAARQLLIRELFKAWEPLNYELKQATETISPVRHVLNLISAVDPEITERVIYREYELFNFDT